MKTYDTNDTITAISTPLGESGIGIVRISGKNAFGVADKIFLSKDGAKPSSFQTYTVHYGWIINRTAYGLPRTAPQNHNAIRNTQYAQRDIIDEVILTVMRAPRSYTKEDIAEINCHGGIVPLRAILDLVLENGCRLALPGEFTMRAFLNGRIDLSQAEAVLDVIKAKTDSALKIGIQQLKGALSAEINRLRGDLLEVLASLEADIDFPEEEITPVNAHQAHKKLNSINNRLISIINNSEFGRVLREGINVVICGKPNVGKSSLLNALLKQERSIVTPIAGTTRDTIEEIIDIKGIPIRIVDTAGIIEPRDLIERKAIQRSKKYIDAADLVLLLFDASKKISQEDETLIKKLKTKKIIAVINKIDLTRKIEKSKISRTFSHIVEISAKKSKNINLLEDKIAELIFKGTVMGAESILIGNLRHIRAIKDTQKLIAQALNSLDNKLSAELIAEDIKNALAHLDDILGKRFSQELLNKIFSEFCIGK